MDIGAACTIFQGLLFHRYSNRNLAFPLIVLSRSLPILIPSATVKGHILRSSDVFLCKELESNGIVYKTKLHKIIVNHLCFEKIHDSYQTALNPSSDGFERFSMVR
jgi:hypothetical protein